MEDLNTSQFSQVGVVKRANVYFDGKCVSHTVLFADGTKKTVGVILPSTLTFSTESPEMMEGIAGSCRVRLRGDEVWRSYGAGETFAIAANSSFEIACDEPYHYVCHFA